MMIQSKFISSIQKYAIGQELKTVFLFTTPQNDFNLIDYTPPAEEDTFIAIAMENPDILSYQQSIAKNESRFLYITAINIQLNRSHEESGDLWLDANPALVYMYTKDGGVKGIVDEPLVAPLTRNQDNRYLFIDDEKELSKTTKLYANDSLQSYTQIINSTANEHSKTLMKYHQFTLICFSNLAIVPGKFCYLHINNESTDKKSLFSQKFLVESVSQIFQKTRGSTIVTLSAPGLSYSDMKDIVGLYSPIYA